MDMQAVLKAGGIGAAIVIVLNLLGLIPCVGCITWLLILVAYVGIGVLAARWMAPPRTGSGGAVNGAVAAVIAAFTGGLVNAIITSIYASATGAGQFSQILSNMPPEMLQQMADAGIDPGALMAGGVGIAGILTVATLCCLAGMVIAAALGAAGGAFWGSSHPQ